MNTSLQFGEASMGPLILLPAIIDAPGEYITRRGERVDLDSVSARHRFACAGRYRGSGIIEHWHKSGRLLVSRETANDIVGRADRSGAGA